jgi:hypothetical protein
MYRKSLFQVQLNDKVSTQALSLLALLELCGSYRFLISHGIVFPEKLWSTAPEDGYATPPTS